MWSHRDPNLRKTGNGNVFVKNLDKNVDNKALYDTFSLFGNILSCKVATDSEGKSRGYGFVHYETAEAAKQAIEKVNGMQIGEKMVYVGEFIPRDGRQPAEVTNFTNLYIKNFPLEWDEDKLQETFAQFGKVTSSMIQENQKRGKKFAFVNYETAEEAKKAIEDMHMKDLRSEEEKTKYPEGKPKEENEEDSKEEGEDKHETIPADDHPDHLCYCQRAQTKQEREASLKTKFNKLTPVQQIGVNLYIKNLNDDVDDKVLEEMFVPYGEITSAHIMKDPKGRSKGFGFVCYKTPDEATKAVTEMHLKVVKGKPLYVGLAEKKDERSMRLSSRYKGTEKGKGGLVTFDGKGGAMNPGKGMPGQQPAYWQQGQQQMPQKGQPGMMPQQMPQMQQFPGNMMMQQQRPGMPMMQQQMRPGMYGMNPAVAMQGKGVMPMPQAKGMPPQGQMAMQQVQMGKGGFNMKGMPVQPQMGVPQQGRPGQPGQQGQQPPRAEQQLTAQMLQNAPQGMQKQMLGEKLYPAVSRLQPELAGKITGMMLEMDNSELLMMLEHEGQLRQKVEEAMRVLSSMPK